MNYSYIFPAVKGIQGGREYFIGMVPLNLLERLFPSEEEYVLPEFRAQRRLNENRIPIISKYILDNRNSYVFSALAASIDGDYTFIPNGQNSSLGNLEISMNAIFLINDGQHRKAAIINAMKEDPSLRDETISIVFYTDKGLERSQQIFTDLNKNALRTSNSISELYDSRDSIAVITRKVIGNIEFLNRYTDKEKDILGKYSSKLFTLNTFYKCNKYIIGTNHDMDHEEICKFLYEFWNSIANNIVPWQMLQNREITKVELRENYIVTQGIVIQAFARIGKQMYSDNGLRVPFERLQEIDWNRSSKVWVMRAINLNGKIITNSKAAILVGNIIKQQLGVELSADELVQEKVLNKQ